MTLEEVHAKFPNTVKAVAVYKVEDENLYAELREIKTKRQFAKWEKKEEAVIKKLRDAYWQDTKEFNSRTGIDCVTPTCIVRFIETGSFR